MRRLKSVFGADWRPVARRRPGRWLPQSPARFFLWVDRDTKFDLQWIPRAGISLLAVHLDPLSEMPRVVPGYRMEEVMKRRTAKVNDGKAPKHLAPMESDFLCRLVPLIEHVACTAYDDGEPRKVGWWTLRTVGAAYQIEVKDPDTCSRLVITGATLDEVLILASTLLASEDAPWEPDPWLQAAQRKNKK